MRQLRLTLSLQFIRAQFFAIHSHFQGVCTQLPLARCRLHCVPQNGKGIGTQHPLFTICSVSPPGGLCTQKSTAAGSYRTYKIFATITFAAPSGMCFRDTNQPALILRSLPVCVHGLGFTCATIIHTIRFLVTLQPVQCSAILLQLQFR